MSTMNMRALALSLVCAVTVVGCGRVGSGNVAPTGAPVSTAGAGPDFDAVDAALRTTFQGSLAFTTPTDIALDDTRTLTLLISPSSSEADLQQALAGADPVAGASVAVTPRMRAELIASPAEAFEIQPLHADPEQLLGSAEPTRWEWALTARQEGRHRLTLSVYRLVTVDGRDYWRQVSYARDIEVTVSLPQRLALLDWKWIVGLIVTGIAVPIVQTLLKRRRRTRAPSAKP